MGNLKKTWKSIDQCLNRNPKSKRIAIIKDANDKDIESDDMPNAFNKHFINIGSNLAQSFPNLIIRLSITSIEWIKYSLFGKYPKMRLCTYTVTKHVNQ